MRDTALTTATNEHKHNVREWLLKVLILHGVEHQYNSTDASTTYYAHCLNEGYLYKKESKAYPSIYGITNKGLEFINGNGIQ